MKKFLVKISYYTSGSYGDQDKNTEEAVVSFCEADLENIDNLRRKINERFSMAGKNFSIDKFFYLGDM